jgi:hypothetical protein
MKISTSITLLLEAILVLSILLYIVYKWKARKEGWADDITQSQSDYKTLQTRLRSTMANYCDLATYAQAQMKEIYMAPKPAQTGPTESEADAIAHIKKTYMDVYACRDDDAPSRQTCASPSGTTTTGFVPCSTYSLPDWKDPSALPTPVAALLAVPDNLADRVSKEVDWYAQIIKKLQDALAMGVSPPSSLPDSPNSPATDASGKPWSTEGFTTCTSAQVTLQQQQQQEAEQQSAASSCTTPSIDAEIARVNALLDSNVLQDALSKCSDLKKSMMKLKDDQQKAKDGTLYDWQKSPPKKSYKTYSTSNRSDALVGSMQQNR